ncbi:peptide MFS transporter [Stigmatella sp. ncwal1]|uniref:Peptide MFS transporter n=1 Tax=Stigmatella ashevillensis TaxID=2995309 RepID=A0ABT5DRH4_9BACT|nr:peptide MFS transporter [Stigmatella ashevillena]MDC0714991.1 peptide MFS transporter [Stigmatella ashevillena]
MSTSTAQQFPSGPPSSAEASSSPPSEAPKGHPKGLYVLFATEMWERFSYYGMRALLVLYLLNYLQFQPADSSSVFKWYTSLVYLTPLLGGFIADRFLGLRSAIIIGAVLMAIGHFLMAFEPLPIFYTALVFLIAGNGFFKPNISTLVGKLYKQGDPRRDGAFTIFYMGINIGAFLAPLICGWLRRNMGPTPGMGYHWGFGAAGVGMVLSLIIFLIGQKQVLRDVAAAGNLNEIVPQKKDSTALQASAEEPDEQVPSTGGFGGAITKVFPWLLFLLAVVVPASFFYQAATGQESWTNVIMPTVFALIGAWMGWTLLSIKNAARDKSTVIFVIFTFVVLFWMAFEQAGNALNIWAAYNTAPLDLGLFSIEGEDYQAANAFFIIAFAPLLAMMWTGLARRGMEIPTAAKMLAAMFLITASFGAMVAGAAAENGTVTRVPLAALPEGIQLETLNAGRFGYEPSSQELTVRGVLAPFAVTNALRPTVDKAYMAQIEAMEVAVKNASPERPVTFQFTGLPPGYTFPLSDKQGVSGWNAESRAVTMVGGLSPVSKAQLVGSGAPPAWRQAITSLAEQSKAAQVSGLWLLLSFLLATLGELCLSPVGLSMVTKLAPTRFASLFMGVWLMSNAVAQYVGGSLGEKWGQIVPTSYFAIFVYSSLVGAVVLLILQAPLKRLMHNVR